MKLELKGFRIIEGEIVARHEIRVIPDEQIDAAMEGNALLSLLKRRASKVDAK